ncbi:hypothetical protein EMIHUDRAFT_227050 [Emiliania huxleyi CCMP1516]|uniref:Uncharacterized protein n=2 Tax=Emiliania huxleyi TaxID=2903 RepID=A0A0D3KJK5_EMIH1|nr:hypothetical protein EMIHUDRAFT_227050 [Emiliania huxleyi CCMP1516]EOD35940.1 hypothetical protein EMIHUDRAFT_227050 [Emiliania huxleyi CCMP1516]|eukprot:XP_005788369.1 hypothetical protein EMIHUDRAFT_227050 [Emiliania huxleyi CCMP1516]
MAHSECLAKRLGATCLAAADERLERGQHGPGPAVSAGKQPWERVCVRCKDNGFAVDRSIVRRVPRDELLALRQKGGSNDGFRDAPACYAERFQYLLVNDSGDLSKAEGRTWKDGPKHKDVSQDGALVILVPGSPPFPSRWEIPTADDGKLRLAVKYKTFVPKGRSNQPTALQPNAATPTQHEGQGRNAPLTLDNGLTPDLLTDLDTTLAARPSFSSLASTSSETHTPPFERSVEVGGSHNGAHPARKRPAVAPVDDLAARAVTLQISGLGVDETAVRIRELRALADHLEKKGAPENPQAARELQSELSFKAKLRDLEARDFEPDGLQLRSAGASRRSERGEASPSAAKQEPSDESSDEEEAIVYRSTRR